MTKQIYIIHGYRAPQQTIGSMAEKTSARRWVASRHIKYA